jgi:hypothetical protein
MAQEFHPGIVGAQPCAGTEDLDRRPGFAQIDDPAEPPEAILAVDRYYLAESYPGASLGNDHRTFYPG